MARSLLKKTSIEETDEGNAPSSEALAAFREKLDQVLTNGGGPEDAINALLAFYGSRSDRASDLRLMGDALFSALNKAAPQSVTVGRYQDRHIFLRVDDHVYLLVDGEGVARRLPRDDAIRLATLLHGAPQASLGDLQAA